MALVFDKFLLFGDSITEYSHKQPGFSLSSALQDVYTRKLDIVTRGFSGYNTDWALPVLREVLKTENASPGKVKIMYIFLGTNDAATTFQHVPLDRYKANLTTMVKMAHDLDIKVIIVGPGLHDQILSKLTQEAKGHDQPFSSSTATRDYGDAAREVALKHKLPFVDLWYAFQKNGGWSTDELLLGKPNLSEYLADGIHYTSRAYQVFFDALIKAIKDSYPEFHYDNLPRILPWYSDIDLKDPEKSILATK